MNRRATLSWVILLATAAVQAPAAKRAVPSWYELKAAYDYRAAETFTVEERHDATTLPGLRLHIEFPSSSGGTVTGVLIIPKGKGPFPCSLLLHGLSGNKEQAIGQAARLLLPKGIACLALDAPHHGERRTPDDHSVWVKMFDQLDTKTPGEQDLAAKIIRADTDGSVIKQIGETIKQGVLDYRRAIDYLENRPDIDSKHIGLIGSSMGAIMGSILASVDDRVKEVGLMVGGDPFVRFLQGRPEAEQMLLATISPSFFVSHIAPRPMFMVNGRSDLTIPRSATDLMYYAAKDPKSIRWYDSGHKLPDRAFLDMANWTAERLDTGTGSTAGNKK